MKVTLESYQASDRRVYNGALCSDMQREVNRTNELLARLRRASPDASCTYFPAEAQYMVFVKHLELTGNFHARKQEALIEAIIILEKTPNKEIARSEEAKNA